MITIKLEAIFGNSRYPVNSLAARFVFALRASTPLSTVGSTGVRLGIPRALETLPSLTSRSSCMKEKIHLVCGCINFVMEAILKTKVSFKMQ